VPEGFDVDALRECGAANYRCLWRRRPNGDLYALERWQPARSGGAAAAILRLREYGWRRTGGRVTEFVKDLDSPRGLVWDHDRLYVVHPPHVSVFIDRDGDGRGGGVEGAH